jgi:hypothetical protein
MRAGECVGRALWGVGWWAKSCSIFDNRYARPAHLHAHIQPSPSCPEYHKHATRLYEYMIKCRCCYTLIYSISPSRPLGSLTKLRVRCVPVSSELLLSPVHISAPVGGQPKNRLSPSYNASSYAPPSILGYTATNDRLVSALPSFTPRILPSKTKTPHSTSSPSEMLGCSTSSRYRSSPFRPRPRSTTWLSASSAVCSSYVFVALYLTMKNLLAALWLLLRV